MTLTREQLLAPAPVDVQEIDIPELGGSVFVHGMTVTEKTAFDGQFLTSSGSVNKRKYSQMRVRLLIKCVRDADGKQLLTEDDIDAIGQQRADLMERLFDAAMRFYNPGTATAKNSETTDEDNSS